MKQTWNLPARVNLSPGVVCLEPEHSNPLLRGNASSPCYLIDRAEHKMAILSLKKPIKNARKRADDKPFCPCYAAQAAIFQQTFLVEHKIKDEITKNFKAGVAQR